MILKDIASEINTRLMIKESSSDIPVTLSMPEHTFKKVSDKFNRILLDLYKENKRNDIKMFDILMSLSPYFDFSYMVENILSDKIIKIVRSEMKDKVGITNGKKKDS